MPRPNLTSITGLQQPNSPLGRPFCGCVACSYDHWLESSPAERTPRTLGDSRGRPTALDARVVRGDDPCRPRAPPLPKRMTNYDASCLNLHWPLTSIRTSLKCLKCANSGHSAAYGDREESTRSDEVGIQFAGRVPGISTTHPRSSRCLNEGMARPNQRAPLKRPQYGSVFAVVRIGWS